MKKGFFVVLLCFPLLTGCWDKKELNQIGIVVAMGIDKDQITEEIILTAQVIRPEALQKDVGSANKSPIEFVTSKGRTLFDAWQTMVKQFDRRPYFAHCRLIVISESLAESGLQAILDALTRWNEARPLSWVVIAKGASPEEILSVKHGVSTIQARYLTNIIELRDENSEANVTYLQQFIEDLLAGGITPTTGVVEIKLDNNDKKIVLTGAAVFKKDKLAGYLTDEETRGVNWIIGNVKRGKINTPSLTKNGKTITAKILKMRSRIKPEKRDGEFIFNIEISGETELAVQQDDSDTSKPDVLQLIEKEQTKVIEREVNMAINKMRNELKVDILGFGNALYREYPKDWKKIKNNWESMLSDMKYTVKVDTKITRTGLLLEPIKIKQ